MSETRVSQQAPGVSRHRSGMVAAAVLVALALLVPPRAQAGAHSKAIEEGQAAAERGDWDWAVLHFQRALDLRPEDRHDQALLQQAKIKASYAHFELAKRHLVAGNAEAAISELQQTVALNPSHQYAYVELEKAIEQWRQEQAEKEEEAEYLDRLKQDADQQLGAVPKLDPRGNVPIQFDMQDKTLDEIFKVIRDVTGINVIFDEGVKKDEKISFVTENVTLEEALDLLMLQQTLAYKVYNDHTILVYPDNQTKQREYEDQIIRTFYLSNADAKEVSGVLRSVMDVRKTANHDKLNAITILDTADKIAIAGKLIETADKAKAELIIDLEILEVDRSKLKRYGIDLTTGAGGGINTTIAFDDDEIRLNNLQRLRQLGSYILSPIPSAVITLIRTDADTRSLARPQVRVTDGEKVQLHLGDQVPIPNTSFNTSNTVGSNVVPVTSYTYQDVGIQVSLEPRIHHNREITLKLQAEISAVTSVNNSGQPTIGAREIDTVIRLRDGESNLLAGLFQEVVQGAHSGLPGLSNIPFLKHIFGTTTGTSTETEIVVTVTPHIIRVPDIGAADLAPLHVGTERNRRLRGVSKTGAGGSPFASPDDLVPEDPFTALRPGATQTERDSIIVPDLDSVTRKTGGTDSEGAVAGVLATAGGGGGGELGAAGGPAAGEASGGGGGAPGGGAPASTGGGGGGAPSGGAPASTGGSSSVRQGSTSAAEEDDTSSGAEAPPPPGAGAIGGASPAPGPGAPSPSGPVVLTLVPAVADVALGQQFDVEVRVDTHGHELAHAPYHVVFDPARAEAVRVAEGSFFRDAGVNTVFFPNMESGRVIIGHSQMSRGAAATGAGVLARITLRAAAVGPLALGFERVTLADPTNDPLPVQAGSATVQVHE